MSARDVIDLTLMGRGYDRTEGTSNAILAALRAAGYAVVPREATPRMCEMGADELPTMAYDGTDDEAAAEIYRAMIEAADA